MISMVSRKFGGWSGLPNSVMSAPAIKVRPAQTRTVAMVSSLSAWVKLSDRPWRTCWLSAFTGGLLTVMMPMSSSLV